MTREGLLDDALIKPQDPSAKENLTLNLRKTYFLKNILIIKKKVFLLMLDVIIHLKAIILIYYINQDGQV